VALKRYLLDTSAYSAFRRGLPGALEAIAIADRLTLPVVVIGELLAGFESGSRADANRRDLADFLSSSRVELASVGTETAERYARIHAALRKAGRPLATNDLWIAATAMEHGTEILTLDEDFLRVPHVLVRLIH
jgi:predicted nucleic acid-binding protein